MKCIILIIISFVCSVLPTLASNDSYWKSVYSYFDKLSSKAELWTRNEGKNVDIVDILSKMDSISATHPYNKEMRARLLYWKVCANPYMDLDSANMLLDEAIALADNKYEYDIARFSMQKAVILSKQEQYPEAYRLYISSAKKFAETGDLRLQAYCYYNIAYIFLLLGEYSEAEANILSADSIFEKLNLREFHLDSQLMLASIYERSGKSSDARKILDGMAQIDQSQLPLSLRCMFLTTYLPYLSDPDSLAKYSDEAYKLAKKTGDRQFYLFSLLNKGWAFLEMNQSDSAFAYAVEAKDCLASVKSGRGIEGVCKLMAAVYASEERWDSAYHYQVQWYEKHEKSRGEGVLADVKTIGMRHEIETFRINAIVEKEKEATLSRAFMIVGISLFALLVVSVYVIYLLRRKMQAEQIRQMEKDKAHIERLRHEKELVESKNRELSSNSLLLIKKNESLKKTLKEMESIHKNYHVDIRGIKSEIVSSLKDDESWDSFKLHFEKVHPQFFSVLKSKYPKLTDNELRLCAYIRIGLSNKQIAQMLLVQSKAVLQARYRLKKRMGLPEDVSVGDFLATLPLPDSVDNMHG